MAGPSKNGGRPRAAPASPLATTRASTAPGNRRRPTNGKVCSNTSPYPKASMPRGRPPLGMGTNRAVAQPAATSASTQPPRPASPLLHDLTLPPPGIHHIHPQATTPCTPRVTPHVLNGWTSPPPTYRPDGSLQGCGCSTRSSSSQPPTNCLALPSRLVRPRQGASS